MSERSLPPADLPEPPTGDLLLRRLLAASHRENAELRRRLTQSGEFEVPRPEVTRGD